MCARMSLQGQLNQMLKSSSNSFEMTRLGGWGGMRVEIAVAWWPGSGPRAGKWYLRFPNPGLEGPECVTSAGR